MTTEEKNKPVQLGNMQAHTRELFNKGIGNEGTCSTEAAVADKTITLGTTFNLVQGAKLLVKFTNAISVENATLAVTHTDLGGVTTTEAAKPIYYRGSALGVGLVKAGDAFILQYDGTSFNIVGTVDQDLSGKQDVINDLSTIRSNAAAGATAYQKPSTGIPASDMSLGVQESLDKADTALQEHQSKSDIGLGNVTNDAQVKRAEMGVASGVATLDATGKVPSSQLPSYVDDVLEFTNRGAFPAQGEGGKIYVALDTNKTYRWGGTDYAEISESLALGETQGTAYEGSKGKVLADKLAGIEDGAQKHIAPTATEVKTALGTGSGTAKYLREDGTWQTPPDTAVTAPENHYSPVRDSASDINAEDGQEAEEDTVVQVVTGIQRDNKGHVTGVASAGIRVGGGGSATGKILVNLEAYINDLKSVGSDLNGLEVTVTNTTDSTVVGTQEWAGSTLTFAKLVPLKAYSVSVEAKTGYTVPTAQTIASLGIGEQVTKTFRYEADEYTIDIDSNQSDKSDIASAVVTVGSTDYQDGDTFRVVKGTQVSPTASEVTDYKVTVSLSNKTISALYETCVVTFAPTVSDNDGSEQQATGSINGTSVAYGQSVKVAFDETIAITCDLMEGYATPTFTSVTASSASLTPSLAYQTDIYQVSITSNQGTDAAISEAWLRAAYTYDGQSFTKQASSGGIKIPTGVTPTISASSNVTGYSKAVNVDSSNKVLSVVYSTTKVWVSAASNQGTLPTGLAFTINGESVTPNDNTSFVKVPTGETFTLVASDATGYAKAITGNGAASGTAQEVHVQYDTTKVYLSMAGENGGVEGEAPTGAAGTVKYSGGADQTLTNNTDFALVPTGTAFTIDYASVNGYATPASYSATASGTSMTATKATYIYGVLELTVAMSDSSSADLARVAPQISINGGSASAMTGSGGVFTANLEVGDTYAVTFNSLVAYGYQSPASISGTFNGGVQQESAAYQTTIYTLTSIQTTKDGSVQGTNPSGAGCTLAYSGLATPIALSTVNATAKVPSDLTPTVTANDVYGYAKNATVSSTNISLTYATEAYHLTVNTNQSDASSVLASTVIRVSATGISSTGYTDYTGAQNATEVLVPDGSAVTAAVQSGAPSSDTYSESMIVDDTTKTITALYQTEKLTVTVNTDQSSVTAEGQVITINGSTYTVGSTGIIEASIPFDTTYSISADGKSGYTTPATQSLTASQPSRVVTMTYIKVSLGVFIYTTDGSLIESTGWSTSGKSLSDVVGIAVLTADHQFVIAPESLGTKKIFNTSKGCTGLSTITSNSVAKQRFEGAADTDVMVQSTNYGTDTTYAAGAAKAYSRGGKSWYLPSCGELQVAYDNKAAVDAALSACGATAMDTNNYHWTSTYYGPYSSYFYFWRLYWSYGNVVNDDVSGNYSVRPFCAF